MTKGMGTPAHVCAAALIVVAACLGGCNGSNSQRTTSDVATTSMARSPQRMFATPKDAASALLAACRANDREALIDLFGSDHAELVDSGDAAGDRAARTLFAKLADEKQEFVTLQDGELELVIGNTQWPFPIPLVRESDGRWRWDSEAGADELLSRRIGRNELAAIEICEAYVAAQAEYSRIDHDGDQVLEFAQRLASTPGRRDGLYWEKGSDDEFSSPLDLLAAIAKEVFPDRKEGDPLMGYRFRVLTRQGSNVPGGKYDYVINGNMIAGFALVAWPAEYGRSGIMTFVVSHQGKLLQQDFGDDTSAIAQNMKSFDPDATWSNVQ